MNTFPKKYPYFCYLKDDNERKYFLMVTKKSNIHDYIVFGHYFIMSKNECFSREFSARYDDIILIE